MKKTIIPPLVIIGALFFIFGFITWLNGTLIPFLKLACELTYAEALLVTFAFYIAYVFLALPSSLILQRTGFKNGMALGLVVMAGGALVFVPAAQTRSFGLFCSVCSCKEPVWRCSKRPPIPTPVFWGRWRAQPGASASWAFATRWPGR
ncbi:MAG: hypothetical protein WKG07_50040 [Hymenobacter sp.]